MKLSLKSNKANGDDKSDEDWESAEDVPVMKLGKLLGDIKF